MASIATQLKLYRELNNLNQSQVAETLEISPSAYNHYESGVRTPGADILQKLAVLYNLEEPLLGVYKKNTNSGSILHNYSVSDIIKNTSLNIRFQSKTRRLHITENQFSALCNYLKNLLALLYLHIQGQYKYHLSNFFFYRLSILNHEM